MRYRFKSFYARQRSLEELTENEDLDQQHAVEQCWFGVSFYVPNNEQLGKYDRVSDIFPIWPVK